MRPLRGYFRPFLGVPRRPAFADVRPRSGEWHQQWHQFYCPALPGGRALFGGQNFHVDPFSDLERRTIRALANEICESREGERARRTSSRTSAHSAPSWLPAGKRLADVADVMRALGVRHTKLHELRRSGQLRSLRLDGRVKFEPNDVEEFIARLRRS